MLIFLEIRKPKFPKATLQKRRSDKEDAMFFFSYVQRRERPDVVDVVVEVGSRRLGGCNADFSRNSEIMDSPVPLNGLALCVGP